MKIRWTDLEAGDTLCFNPEFESFFYMERGRRPDFSDLIDEDKFFLIKRIDFHDDLKYMEIDLDADYDGQGYVIVKETGSLANLPNGPALFKVCGLAK